MKIPELSRATTIARTPAGRPRPIDVRQVELVRRTIAAIDGNAVRDVMVEEYKRREARALERELRRGRPRPVQCFSCKRFKPRPSSICGQCGDDPVGRTTHMDPTPFDRQRFDESYYGERVA